MSGTLLRLIILLAIFFGCLGIVEESVYLALAVFKSPLLALVPIALVLAFLVFVGKMAGVRMGRHYE